MSLKKLIDGPPYHDSGESVDRETLWVVLTKENYKTKRKKNEEKKKGGETLTPLDPEDRSFSSFLQAGLFLASGHGVV